MNIGNIKNRRLPALELACERYAIMAFEHLNETTVIGAAVELEYKDSSHTEGLGTFAADFRPAMVCDCPKKADRTMTVEWTIISNGDGHWRLYGGMVTVQGVPEIYTVVWSEDGSKMLFLHNDDGVDTTGFKGSVVI